MRPQDSGTLAHCPIPLIEVYRELFSTPAHLPRATILLQSRLFYLIRIHPGTAQDLYPYLFQRWAFTQAFPFPHYISCMRESLFSSSSSKINVTFFITNLMLNIFMLNNCFRKSVFSEETAKNCFGGTRLWEPKWTNFWSCVFPALYISWC